MCTFGRQLLSAPPGGDAYALRYKGTAAAMTAVQRALTGNYVNFGVFDLYGDRALADALDCVLACACAVPLSDLMGYQKARGFTRFGSVRLDSIQRGLRAETGAAARRSGHIGGCCCPRALHQAGVPAGAFACSARGRSNACASLSCVGRPYCPYAGEQGVLRAD